MPKQFETNVSGANKLIYDRKDGLFVQMPVETPATRYEKGQAVYITGLGNVEIMTPGQVPFGYVSVANIPNDPSGPIHHADYVTVGTFCSDGAYGIVPAGSPLIFSAGNLMTIDGQSAIDPAYGALAAPASGQYALGITMEGGGAEDVIKFLYFNAPLLVP